MLRSLLLVALFCLVHHVAAILIDVPPHKRECFFEELQAGDKLTITFQVGDGGNRDLDFQISDPTNQIIKLLVRQSTGTQIVEAKLSGRYTYCFINEMSSVTAKSVNFNAHDVQKLQKSANEHIDPLEREIAELSESIFSIKAEQEYIVARERQHRDTAESTNARVKWWSLGQLAFLAAVCFWQVTYLKRFFEVRRVV